MTLQDKASDLGDTYTAFGQPFYPNRHRMAPVARALPAQG